MADWYYRKKSLVEDTTFGPVSFDDLRVLVIDGKVTAKMLVSDGKSWLPTKDVFADELEQAAIQPITGVPIDDTPPVIRRRPSTRFLRATFGVLLFFSVSFAAVLFIVANPELIQSYVQEQKETQEQERKRRQARRANRELLRALENISVTSEHVSQIGIGTPIDEVYEIFPKDPDSHSVNYHSSGKSTTNIWRNPNGSSVYIKADDGYVDYISVDGDLPSQ